MNPTPYAVLDATGDINHHLRIALRALMDIKPRTKTDQANVRCIKAQLEYAQKLSDNLNNVAGNTISQVLNSGN